MYFIDTHCHLEASEFDSDRSAVLQNAQNAGVNRLFIPSVHPCRFEAVRSLCASSSSLFPAYGIHPLYVDRLDERALPLLKRGLCRELDGAHPPLALGEIGLDFLVKGQDVVRQEAFFAAQLALAREFDLPVLLHARGAIDAVLKGLRKYGVQKGILHAFNGSFQQADALIQQGFFLGLGGALTYPRATKLQNLARQLPLERIVLETDAPDMPPIWLQHQRNTPEALLGIAQTIADLRDLSLEALAHRTSQNAQSLMKP